MKKIQLPHLTLIGIVILLTSSFSSCEKLFDSDDDLSCNSTEMKLPEIKEGALFKYDPDPNGFIKPTDTLVMYPGFTSGVGYKGPLERDLSNMKVRWTFERGNVLINPETGKFYPKEEVENMPSYQFSYGKSFTTNLSDNQIQTGDILTSYQAVIFNKCGESNPITGYARIINSGIVLQRLNELSEIARMGHIQAFYKNKLYILFGKGGEENYTYDITTRKLTQLPPIDFGQFGFDLNDFDTQTGLQRALYGDRSGYGPFTTYAQEGAKLYFAMPKEASYSDDILWEYDLETLTLSKIASIDRGVYTGTGPSDPAVKGFASAGKMVLVDNKIYYYPLYKGDNRSNIGIFDLDTKQWSEEDLSIPQNDLVPSITYMGNPNYAARKYFQLFYAINNQLKLVFEDNREVTYDLETKQLSAKSTDYKHTAIDAQPNNGFVYNGAYYFEANGKSGPSYTWYKKRNNEAVEKAFPEIGAFPGAGSQFTPVGNTLIFVGGSAIRYWLEK